MKRTIRILLIMALLAALPLRGYAGVLTALCGAQHGGAAAAHEHDAGHAHDSGKTDDSVPQVATVCSLCASCCASASLATGAIQPVAFSTPGTNRIPFFDRQVSGFVPDHLDRPPLPL